jgi:hypothetical protein
VAVRQNTKRTLNMSLQRMPKYYLADSSNEPAKDVEYRAVGNMLPGWCRPYIPDKTKPPLPDRLTRSTWSWEKVLTYFPQVLRFGPTEPEKK